MTQKKTHNPKKQKKAKDKDNSKNLVNEYKDMLQRLQAEFDNYKKRTEKEKQELAKFATKEIILKLLPIIDNFDLAIKHRTNGEEFAKGIEMIHTQLNSLLEQEGLSVIDTEKFDPYLHEALIAEESDKEENTILEELQRGYILKGKVLRPAKVKVSKCKK